jgi:hypothetical protein
VMKNEENRQWFGVGIKLDLGRDRWARVFGMEAVAVMVAEETPKRKRNRTSEYSRRKVKRAISAEAKAVNADKAIDPDKAEAGKGYADESVKHQLSLLEKRTKDRPTDADGDIDFAYRNMANPNVEPLSAPSTAAWSWYEYARTWPAKFLEICAKREDAKAKQAGTITNQRMEDDKRQQFAILDRIEQQLTLDVRGMVKDLMDKFPREVLRECRKYGDAWKSFHAEECQ